ncbi:MAG: hypothetical protein AB8G15_11915 [Saprospiraceae bacterium]
MKKSKLLIIFERLGKWEIKQFQQFVQSPFFNQRTDVIRLLDFLIQEKETGKSTYERAVAFRVVYPNKDFMERDFYLLSSYLYKLLEEFLAIRAIRQNEVTMKLHLAQALQKIKLDKKFTRTIDNSKKVLQKQVFRNGNYLRQAYDLELAHYNFIGSQVRSAENNLQALSDLFDVYYLAEKLKQFCLQWAHQTVFKKEYDVGMQKEIFSFLETHPDLFNHPAIAIYYHCYQAIAFDDDVHFEKLLALIPQHQHQFPQSETRDIYLLAINFCIKQLNAGEQKYEAEMFALYQTGIENKYLIKSEELSRFTFNNIVLLGIKLGKLEWVESFIYEQKQLLPKKLRQAVFEYSLAGLRYEQKQYAEAMRLLATFESNDHLMNLGAKLTLLKIYYELKEFDALYSLLDSMRVYLQRKEILGYHKAQYGKIISLTKKLISLAPSNRAAKLALQQEIESSTSLTRNISLWLLRQLE